MPSRVVYDLLYRVGAARWRRGWDTGVAPELRALIASGALTPAAVGGNRAVDLGCGSGANTRYLAQQGFAAVGVDFSRAGIDQARSAAADEGVDATFVVADITEPIEGLDGPFDVILLYNIVQDLDDAGRAGLAARTFDLGRPGTRVLLWCWFGAKAGLPLISYRGPSRIAPFVVEPGEERRLFPEDAYRYEMPTPQPGPRRACFLLERR